MNANQIINKLIAVEVDKTAAPDMRRVIRDERLALQVAAQSGDAAKIGPAMREAVRVAKMWGAELA